MQKKLPPTPHCGAGGAEGTGTLLPVGHLHIGHVELGGAVGGTVDAVAGEHLFHAVGAPAGHAGNGKEEHLDGRPPRHESLL